MPESSRYEQVGSMMLSQSMKRGLSVTTKKSRSGLRVAMLAFMLVLMGGGVAGWYYREPLMVLAHQYIGDAIPGLPMVDPSVETSPVFGGKNKVGESAIIADSVPTPGSPTKPKLQLTLVVPPTPVEQGQNSVPPLPPSMNLEAATKLADALPAHNPNGPPPPTAQEFLNQLPVQVTMATAPTPANSSPGAAETSAPPPRATPLTEAELAKLVPDANAMAKLQEAASEIRQAVPVMKSTAGGPPDSSSATAEKLAPLVEVGRAKDDPKLAPETLRASVVVGLDRPVIKNVPPECESAAEALKKFLAANNWRERLAFMQLPADMERKAQQYYTSNSDGPIEVDEIEYYHHNENPQVGKGMHVVFVLRSRAWQFPMGVPVMVEVHDNEARVDWLTFVEFKDDLLNRFLTTYMEGPVRFHVGIRRTHYFEDDVPDKQNKNAFEVAPPMGNCRGYVFVPKDTALARSLAGTLSWDKDLSLGVVELQWRRAGGQKWIEMTALPQLNWYSADGSASSESSAPTSPVAKPTTGAAR